MASERSGIARGVGRAVNGTLPTPATGLTVRLAPIAFDGLRLP